MVAFLASLLPLGLNDHWLSFRLGQLAAHTLDSVSRSSHAEEPEAQMGKGKV